MGIVPDRPRARGVRRGAESELDRLQHGLTPDERAIVGLLDLQQREAGQPGMSEMGMGSAQSAAPTYGVFGCLHLWQLLTQRMEDEWPSTDYHLVDEYLLELTVRDAIGEYLEAMPPALREKVSRFVSRVDDRFMAVTVHDGGAELAPHWKPLADGCEARWWWLRKPSMLPPGW